MYSPPHNATLKNKLKSLYGNKYQMTLLCYYRFWMAVQLPQGM